MDDFYTANPHGSTRLATQQDVYPLTQGNGPVAVLGNRVIRFPDQEPSIVLGGAGCGKGAQLGLYQPVHDSTGSFFILDPSGGQALSVTHHWNLAQRRETYVINPYGVSAYPDLNHPVDLWSILKNDEDLLDNAKRIAAMSIIEPEKESENSWVGSGAKRWSRQLKIMLVLLHGRVTPVDFWEVVNQIDSDDQALKDWARLSEHLPYQVYETLVEIYTKKKDAPKEYSAIMSKIKDDYDWLSSPKAAASVSGDVDFLSYLPRRDKKVGIYYAVPGGSGKHNMSLTRNVVGIAQLHCVRANGGHRPLFYLEEAATVGAADFIKSSVSEYRKYFRSILVYQSHGQLTHLFGKSGAQEIIDSCGLQVTMAVRDFDSAKRLADTVGKTTIDINDPMAQGAHAYRAESARREALLGGGDPMHALYIHSNERALSGMQRKSGRYILDPAELLRLKNEVLVIAPGSGVPPILANKLPPYWKNPALAGRYGPDPLFPPLDKVTIQRRFLGATKRPFIREKVPDHLAHLSNHSNGEIAYVQGYRTW